MNSVHWHMQKLISNNKNNNRTPEVQCNKTHFHFLRSMFTGPAMLEEHTIKLKHKKKRQTIAWIYSSSSFIKIN